MGDRASGLLLGARRPFRQGEIDPQHACAQQPGLPEALQFAGEAKALRSTDAEGVLRYAEVLRAMGRTDELKAAITALETTPWAAVPGDFAAGV